MHLLSNLKIIRLIYHLTTIFYLVQEFYFESMIYTLKLVFFFCIFLECCQQKAGDYMLATTKIIRLFAKKGEIQTIPAKNVLPFFQNWQLGTAHVCSSCLMLSTDQADSCCFYFRISWILLERLFFVPKSLLQNITITILDQKFKFQIKE